MDKGYTTSQLPQPNGIERGIRANTKLNFKGTRHPYLFSEMGIHVYKCRQGIVYEIKSKSIFKSPSSTRSVNHHIESF